MTYDEFLLKIVDLPVYVEQKTNHDDFPRYGTKPKKEVIPNSEFIEVRHSTGGMEGGSCWDDSEPRPYTSSDDPEELTQFDTILEHFCPNMTFIQYKNLYRDVVTTSSDTEYEYYGNSTNYNVIRCKLYDLYQEMVKRNILP